jgi:tetratricopeptide (TPR) repeat protein
MTGFVCCSGLSRCEGSYPLPCQLTFEAEARDWAQVAETCRAATWSGRARLAEAWIAYEQTETPQALAILAELAGTDVSADAAFLTGTIRTREGEPSEQVTGRAQLEQTLLAYRLAGRHADASRAAVALSYSIAGSSLDDRLYMAKLAVAEAERSGDERQLGLAHRALAAVFDILGMADAAKAGFRRALAHTEPWPDDLAWTYFKRGVFLLDLGTAAEIKNGLKSLELAAAQVARATRAGRGAQVRTLEQAIRLNRAYGLCQLRDPDAAEHELALIQETQWIRPKLRLVKGYVAASRNGFETAMRMFSEAGLFSKNDNNKLEPDYRWRAFLELARLHRRAGRAELAKQAYREAIETAEHLRGTASTIELRPWVLASRALPYYELLSLLVDQGRGVEALAVAESLHARSWLDAVLSRAPGGPATTEQALQTARIQQRLATSARSRSGPELMNQIGAREALIFVAASPTAWRAHVVGGQVTFQQLPASTAAIVEAYRTSPDDRAAAERAAAVLIPDDLQRGEQPLYIVASGTLADQTLADVMFAGLQRSGRYLIEDRPIAYLPGLVALQCATGPWEENRQVFIGDSRGDRPLPKAREEVTKLAAEMQAHPAVGAAATRAAVQPAGRAGLLHIAVHGSSTQLGRAIAFADGDLTAADVLELGLGPRLAVLTGCRTGISFDHESWGAFPSAFLAAGSRYVIATLRSVDDGEAAELTRAFYAQPAGWSPIHRLAAAQRQLARQLPVEAWASFGAWGNAECAP